MPRKSKSKSNNQLENRHNLLHRQLELRKASAVRIQNLQASSSSSSNTLNHTTPWYEKLPSLSVSSWVPKWNRTCKWCSISLLTNEKMGWCCNNGKYCAFVTRLPPYPPDVWIFLCANPAMTLSISRKLNNLFSFTSIGVSGGFANLPTPSNVAISGRVYHQLRDLSGARHSMHWFIYDEADRYTTAANHQIPIQYVELFKNLLLNVNPFLHHLQHAIQQVPTSQPFAIEIPRTISTSSGEIAAIIHTDNTLQIDSRSIVIWNRSGSQARSISIFSPHYESLQYPVLFPHGTPGWSIEAPCSQIWWYRMRILREPRFHLFSRLFNEYAVDMFSRVEDERIGYYRKGRKIQLQDLRQRIQQQMQEEIQHTDNPSTVDQPINEANCTISENSFIFPSGFMGSRAWASEQVADSLAICRDLGIPSLFITITTNPNWPEIRDRLLPDQTASDIPDIVCRAFRARVAHAITAMKEHFGRIVYLVKVVEFQKRGLPHCHMIIKVEPEIPFSKLSNIISAEIPSIEEDPDLRALVLKFNQHPKNHLDSPNSRCNRDGICCWNFPQPIRQFNELNEFNGRVNLRRRKEEDQWTAPYMPFLTKLLDCHVNVDITSTVNIFLYLYKYLFKGPDRTLFTISNNDIDEAEEYITGRYLSASEAIWRILQFEVTTKEPAVLSLRIHLPGQNLHQMYRSNTSQPESSASDLLRYFARPSNPTFSTVTIQEYFRNWRLASLKETPSEGIEWYLETQSLGSRGTSFPRMKVIKRTKQLPVCRLVMVSPKAGELYYLRAILQQKAGRSYQELRTINGHRYSTFQEAAMAMGLFESENEAEQTLSEAISNYRSPAALRFLFAQVIVNFPSSAVSLFKQFQESLTLDYQQRSGNNAELALELTLSDISLHLHAQGVKMSDYGLPEPSHSSHNSEVQAEYIMYADRKEELLTMSEVHQNQFTDEQRVVFQTIVSTVFRTELEADTETLPIRSQLNNPTVFFLDGKAGRGKTFVVNAIVNLLRGHGKIVLIAGSTALSVTLYEGGRTAHNLFGIPITENNSEVESRINDSSPRADLLRNASLIIWEEMPMSNKTAIECVDKLLRSLLTPELPFGGKIFLGLGDFRQVAPVVKGSSSATSTLDASIKSSSLWKAFTILQLHAPIRNASDPEYSEWIDMIGEGKGSLVLPDLSETISTSTNKGINGMHLITLPYINELHSISEVVNFLYPLHDLQSSNYSIFSGRCFLSSVNRHVDSFNQEILDRIPTTNDNQYHCYNSSDSIKESNEVTQSFGCGTSDLLEYLSLLKQPGIPSSKLELKVGAICTIMRNISPRNGLVKNIRVVVVALAKCYVEVSLLKELQEASPSSVPAQYCLPRITFEFRPNYAPWTIIRKQIPLRLAYASTFNSCQGLTLDRCVIDTRVPVFAHGQLYTAISRVRNRTQIKALWADENILKQTTNVVYKELLL